jgi:hypothetical protein
MMLTLDWPERAAGVRYGASRYRHRIPGARRLRRSPAYRANGALEIRAGGAGLRPARPLVWHGMVRFASDRIHKGVVEALAGGFTFTPYDPEEREAGARLEYSCELAGRGLRDRLRGRLGFRSEPDARERTVLDEHHAQLLKLQFALWARAFAETDADPSQPTCVTLPQLCDDLGYRRQQNGSHRPEHKRQVAEWVELLTSLEVEAEYEAPDGRRARLTGPVWRRFPDWELDRVIAYAPGSWYADPAWSRFNRQVGLVHAGLLALRPDRDPWAIRTGAYLACLSRINGYRPLTVRVSTLLEKTGLAEAERRNPSRMREMLERALERLESCGVIAQWDWFHAASDEPDMDCPDELAGLAEIVPGWENRSLVIRWPEALRGRAASLAAGRLKRQTGPRRVRATADR